MKTNNEQVIAAAAKIFLLKGYKECTTREIAREAGLANSSCLFHYFKTKEDVYQAVIDTYILHAQASEKKYQYKVHKK